MWRGWCGGGEVCGPQKGPFLEEKHTLKLGVRCEMKTEAHGGEAGPEALGGVSAPNGADNSWHSSCQDGSHHPAGQAGRTSLEPRGGMGRPVLCSDWNTLESPGSVTCRSDSAGREWGLRFRISNKLTDAVVTTDARTTLPIDLSQGCTVCGFRPVSVEGQVLMDATFCQFWERREEAEG